MSIKKSSSVPILEQAALYSFLNAPKSSAAKAYTSHINMVAMGPIPTTSSSPAMLKTKHCE
ncbi:MAG: hypothetical protein ACI8PB_004273 [Desulforhopalus sp.]|jgi:hypothetical protein